MAIELDHLILTVGDPARSAAFYTEMLGLARDDDLPPFVVLRIAPGLVLLLAPGDARGGEHLAFALPKVEFDAAFERLVRAGVPYGDRFDTVGSGRGPGDEPGARGIAKALYFFDPDHHLLEIRHYEGG